MKAAGIIPARYQSARLLGKPLVKIDGKPLIQHVYENALKCSNLDSLVVATDDERILEVVQKFGGEAVMTPSDLSSGTDRCAFVARSMDVDIVANIQGDEPFLDTSMIDKAIDLLKRKPEMQVVTAARRRIRNEELENPNIVKVLIDKYQNALYFSRRNIPYIRSKGLLPSHPALAHTGLYVYRKSYLLQFVNMPPSTLEQLEQLEQLRILENGDRIHVVLTDKFSIGIDTPEDVKQAERILKSHEA
ncbi:MAG: 3-deoxy-manno-octulosonate cytidylyltransferase [Candidatus Marinimicrobia bacterium]|nr:3-deoxy-manno-octulosonate cytidylyltransferase [bacterium]MCG2716810.1 3-deoxy-manno-octulosonate cytidylyltransferase [Candidatus Neomarinimicrobiota bacterium]